MRCAGYSASTSPDMTREFLASAADIECCDLVTRGHRTGREHRIEIWFGVIDGRVCLISGNGESAHWYRNLLSDGGVSLVFGDTTLRGRARAVVDAAERRHIGDLMRAKYQWDGDPEIGLTYDAWCYAVPAVWVEFD